MKYCIVSMLACLLLSGCAGHTVTVVDESGFHSMAERIAPVLKSRQIIDDDGSYFVPAFASELPENVGQLLYTRMGTAFRYQDLDPNMIARSFAASKRAGDSLEMRPYGFVMGQGVNMITVSLLGMADWNGDKQDDLFIVCSVRSILGDEERDYYLVIEDINAPGMAPQLLAVYDCRSHRCTSYLQSEGKRANPESDVVDMLPGQQITAPPTASGAARRALESTQGEQPASPAEGGQIGERKLGS